MSKTPSLNDFCEKCRPLMIQIMNEIAMKIDDMEVIMAKRKRE